MKKLKKANEMRIKMKNIAGNIENFNKRIALIGGMMLFAAAIITTYDVSLRFIFNNPTSWALEISQYCLLYGTFLGAAYAFKKDAYIRVDVITNLFSKGWQKKFFLLGHFVAMILFLLIAWHSSKFTYLCFKKGWTEPTFLQTPMWIPLIIIPLGSIFISLQNLTMIFRKGQNE